MSSLSMSPKRFLTLFILLSYSLLYGRVIEAMEMSDLKISYGINDYKSKPIDVTTKVKDDKKIIYASGWIEYVPKDTTVAFEWYREMRDGTKEKLTEHTVEVKSSQVAEPRFVYSSFGLGKESAPMIGRYVVKGVADGKVQGDISFEIVSDKPQVSKAQVNKKRHTKAHANKTNHNKAICKTFNNTAVKQEINRLLTKYPQASRDGSLQLALYSDPKNGIIFYVPNGWYSIPDDDNATILYMSQKQESVINRYRAKKVEKFWDEDDIKESEIFVYNSAKAIGDLFIEFVAKRGDKAKYVGDISLFGFGSYVIAHHVIHHTGTIERYKSSTFLWNGSDLYALEITMDANHLQLGEFLSSLWYMTFCDASTEIAKPEDRPQGIK